MFYENLNKRIVTWIESGKLKYLFSDKRKPDFVITDKMDIAIVLKYNASEMIAPVVLEKSRNSYTQKIVQLCSEKNIPTFNSVFEIQRNKKYETMSVKQPDKIQLELSHSIFSIIGQRRFVIDINGLSIHNIKIIKDTNLKYDEFIIRINGIPVKQGNINYSNIDPFDQLTIHLSEALKK